MPILFDFVCRVFAHDFIVSVVPVHNPLYLIPFSLPLGYLSPRPMSNLVLSLNVSIKSEAQQKKFKTVRGSYTDLDQSIHVKKDPKNLMRHSL